MFTYGTLDITDNIEPFFVQATSTPRPEDITLATFVLQDELSELATLVERFHGK